MNIFFNSRINANQSLLNVLFGQQQKAASSQNTGCRGTRDTLTISASGKEKLTKSTSGRTHNTSIDSSIDLKSYIASAKKTNQELIENAGAQINAKTSEYMSTGKAFRAALTEKYSKLAAEAKTHSNPENYIHSKYFDKSSEYYETNLTDTERRIAYNYEMQMCRTGKINGVNYQDSLFRGIEVDGDSVDSDKIQFERALINSQISNILKQAGVDTSSITKDCTFTVDPYRSILHVIKKITNLMQTYNIYLNYQLYMHYFPEWCHNYRHNISLFLSKFLSMHLCLHNHFLPPNIFWQ